MKKELLNKARNHQNIRFVYKEDLENTTELDDSIIGEISKEEFYQLLQDSKKNNFQKKEINNEAVIIEGTKNPTE